MNINDLTIGEAREIATMFGGMTVSSAPVRVDHGVAIVVLERGFVYVGRVETDAQWVYIEEGVNVRYWGTTKGLGELVEGPTSKTKLDYVGIIRGPMRALISIIPVKEELWAHHLLPF